MKQITPMARLKENLNNLETILNASTKITTNIWIGQARSERTASSYYGGTNVKAIESDYIKVYHIANSIEKDNKHKYSFAFAFNNIKSIEDTYIAVTFKKDEQFFESTFSFEEFKLSLKELNKKLQAEEELNISTLVSIIYSHFKLEDSAKTVDKEVKNIIKSIKKIVEKDNKSLSKTSVELETLSTECNQYKADIKEQTDKLSAELGIKELEALLAEKRKQVKNLSDKLNKKVSLDEKLKKIDTLKYSQRSQKTNIEYKILIEIKKIRAKAIREKVRTFFQEETGK